jgi:4-hydroxybenzoate polyprenyltransferase
MQKYCFSNDVIIYKEIIVFLSKLSNIIRRILLFLTVSSIFTGAAGFFVAYMAFILLGLVPRIQICLSVFLMVFSVYNLNKLTDLKEDAINMPERLGFLENRKKFILYCSLIAYAFSALPVFMDNPLELPIIFIPLAGNAVYSLQLIPGIPRFKDIPIMKNVFVALSLTLVCVLLPATHLAAGTGTVLNVVFFFILIKLYINAVLYDIRDIEGDKENGVRTLPVLIGPIKTVGILLALNCVNLIWLLFANCSIRPIVAALILYGYVYIIYFRKRRNFIVMDFFVDGEWIIAGILLLALKGLGLWA